MNSNSTSALEKADALINYITGITDSTISLNASNTLTISQINQIVGGLVIGNYTQITPDSILVITRPICSNAATVIGASIAMNNRSTPIDTINYNNVTNSQLSAAGVVNFTGQCTSVSAFNIFIIDDPTIYRTTNSSNTIVVSSIIIATIATVESANVPINIELYFQQSTFPNFDTNGRHACAFYDTNSSAWNESGCSTPLYEPALQRFRCRCNHLTSFALIWLPTTPPPDGKLIEYNHQDKASIAFQSISIVCFLGIIIHIVTVRILHPKKYSRTTHLLPIMSCGVTMILFIFYIALGTMVYTRRMQSPETTAPAPQRRTVFEENLYGKSGETELNSRATNDPLPSNWLSSQIPCSSTEHGLMFVVYFLIIFMFSTKISIAVDNYRRYVKLFPPLSYRVFLISMGASLLFSSIWIAFATGFNSNPKNQITEIYQNKLCWFNRHVNHYFLTIPVCLFLVISLALLVPVVKHNISHIHETNEDVKQCLRRKRCIYIILVSCGTQGFGWLFGPVISIASPTAGEVLGWFFIICNGLEGLWALLLYIVVEKEGLDHSPRHADYIARQSHVNHMDRDYTDDHEDFQLKNFDMNNRHDPIINVRSDSPRHSFADIPEQQVIHRANGFYHDTD